MESVKDLAAVSRLQDQLRTAEGLRVDVSVGDARKAYGQIDDFVMTRARGRATWVTSARELESRA